MSAPTPWYRTRRGGLVLAVYVALTVLAVVFSTGWSLPDSFFAIPGAGASATKVPSFVYLYGFLGAMAYAFTSVIAKFERGVPGVLRVGIRAMAALPLAAGVYLLAGLAGIEAVSEGEARIVAGLAFLVGLYVNLTLKALGGVADRLYGRATGESGKSAGSRGAGGDR